MAIQTNNIQLLLCGDLNSLPDSGVVQYLLDGEISSNHKDFKSLSYKNALTKMLSHSANEDSYTHAFKVKHKKSIHLEHFQLFQQDTMFPTMNNVSLYLQLASAITPDIMPVTNYTYDFKGMIDYIFYPKNLMQPFGLLGPVDEEWLKENKIMGCPQPHITSGTNIGSQ